MPWTGSSFRKKHAQHLTPEQAKEAAKVANAILKNTGDEGKAIRVGISQAKKQTGKK